MNKECCALYALKKLKEQPDNWAEIYCIEICSFTDRRITKRTRLI